ncbi:D-aspartate oxidase-like isoform X2 [Babylonia areolata]
MVRIAVIGAGIVGLTTAVNIQKLLPSAQITIIAEKFDNETTSSGAGGLYRPTAHLVKGVPVDTIKGWVKDSWEHYSSLAMSPQAHETGHSLVPGYVVSDDISFVQNPLYEDIVFNFRRLTNEEMKRLKFPFKYGSTFTTVITQPKKFMPYLLRQFRANGGSVECRRVNNIEELADKYDMVANCTGLGAQQMTPDPSMYPVRGQLVLIKAPWIKQFVYCDSANPTYFIPHDNHVIVGGTREQGDYNLNFCPKVQQNILTRAERILPQIKGAEIVGNWVGLRPSRDPLRLEKELLHVKGKKLRVVHNYGHGANGITLSWGTSLQAAKMAQEFAAEIPPSAKL